MARGGTYPCMITIWRVDVLAGVAQPGGDAVDGQQQRAAQLGRVVAGPLARQQIDLEIGDRVQVRAAHNPVPTPNQPGTICRDWVHPNTHGMARSPSMPPPEEGRRDGREPMFSCPSCSTGADARK